MEQKFLIDTNIVIDFSENKFPETTKSFVADIIDNSSFISVINKIELLGFSIVIDEIIEFVALATVIDLDDGIVDMTIELRKKHKIKLPDAIIAATAISHNLTILTRNTKDYKDITNCKFINPWELN